MRRSLVLLSSLLLWAGCDSEPNASTDDTGALTDTRSTDTASPGDTTPPPLPAPSCEAAGGTDNVAAPQLVATLFDRWHEAWLGSPAVADLDGDGTLEILVPRGNLLLGWHIDGSIPFRAEINGGRIWASPIVADLSPSHAGLEVAVAGRDSIYVYDAQANLLPGFPVIWRDELRSIAAGDIDADGALDLVVVTTSRLESGGQRDIVYAIRADTGEAKPGFPPNTSGASGCDDRCYVTGGYDQNIALGNVDDDAALEIFATQDNAYLSLHEGDGTAFASNSIFDHPTRFLGVRFLHDYALAQQGWAPDEDTALQAHFTNSAPAIADIDGDNTPDLVVLASVQNAAQSDRLQGVALWVLHPDGTRLADWTEPFHAPDYLAGLWDYEGTNVVGATNQVSVADIDPNRAGPELVFAGFDGRIHAVSATAESLWSYTYTTSDRVLTGGVAIADLSGDGVPEVVFNSYSPDEGLSHLFVLSAAGEELHKIALPKRGAMPVPTIADADADGDLDIIVSLKDGEDRAQQVLVYEIPGSSNACLLWPTGRGNLLRNGYIAP